jgi:hypothetical protein
MRLALVVAVVVILVGCGYNVAPTSSTFGVSGAALEPGRNNAGDTYKIYVVSLLTKFRTFNPEGERIGRTFNTRLASGVTVDKRGKIYVTISAPNGQGFLSTFTPHGRPTSPSLNNLFRPTGVAVDANGKIYIASEDGVTTYTPDGKPTNPTIPVAARAVAVDKNGKIYVATQGGIGTYTPDGKPTKPTIPGSAVAVAVDKNGKIYVAGGSVRTYTPNGKQTTPTITAGLDDPVSIAVDPNGKIFVVNFGTYLGGPFSVTSYTANGEQTTPTLSNGLTDPVGIAIH